MLYYFLGLRYTNTLTDRQADKQKALYDFYNMQENKSIEISFIWETLQRFRDFSWFCFNVIKFAEHKDLSDRQTATNVMDDENDKVVQEIVVVKLRPEFLTVLLPLLKSSSITSCIEKTFSVKLSNIKACRKVSKF